MNLAIFASGTGSTAEVLFDKASLVISNKLDSGVVQKAKQAGVPLEIVTREGKSLEEFGEELLKVLKSHQIDFISQDGWTVYTPGNVIEAYRGKIINAHPGPLDPGNPDFGGPKMNDLVVHAAVINFSKKINRPFKTEITLHQTTEEFDKGEVVARREVEVLPLDSPQTLQARLKEVEKELLKEFWTKALKDGKIESIKRLERVINPGEEKLLEEAKAEAIKSYWV